MYLEKSSNLSRSAVKAKGFTLIEVLVVMAIIATLLGIGVGAIKSMASSKGVSTAVPLAEGVFKHAIQLAKSTGGRRYVVVYGDTSGDNKDIRERHLRMMGVAQGAGNRNDDGQQVYRLVSRPVTLPSGTFFNPILSDNVNGANGFATFPGSDDAKACYVIGFNAEGNVANGGNALAERRFIIQAGKLTPSGEIPDGDSKNSRDVGGFRIWPSGKTAVFRSADQILDYTGEDGLYD